MITPLKPQHQTYTKTKKTTTTEKNVYKILENMENRFYQMSENLQRKQETQLNAAFEQSHQTIIEFNTQQNQRNESQRGSTQVADFRPQRSETQNNSTMDTQNNSTREPPLPFYKQLTSMSINDEQQIETSNSNGSVPKTIKPFDDTDPGYTVEEYLNSLIAATIFSNGIEPVNRPSHHQWKVKRAALILLHTLPGRAQKWYSALPSETKLDRNYSVKNSQIYLIRKSQNNRLKYFHNNSKTYKQILEITRVKD